MGAYKRDVFLQDDSSVNRVRFVRRGDIECCAALRGPVDGLLKVLPVLGGRIFRPDTEFRDADERLVFGTASPDYDCTEAM